MALILGVYDGMKFYVDDTPVRVVSADEPIVLGVAGHDMELSETKAVEILPNVFVSVGKPTMEAEQEFKQKRDIIRAKRQAHQPLTAWEEKFPEVMLPRIAIEAPREIKILRKKLYDEKRRVPISHI